jgi:dTDP-glucose pyrophosphorylase
MKINLVMPMAGRGSRFAKQGIVEPKPLVELGGKPFFWWAVESLRRAATIDQIAFVVLEEHERDFDISRRIFEFYPNAKVIRIPEVTAGSAETGFIGIAAIEGDGPVAINDCDHAFLPGPLDATLERLGSGTSATLMSFRSSNPGFSYAQLDEDGNVIGTVEKQVVSPFAIAGCYLFQSAELYREQYKRYLSNCAYNELFISGMYNELLREGKKVDLHVLEAHFPFGTPEEYRAVQQPMLECLKEWT